MSKSKSTKVQNASRNKKKTEPRARKDEFKADKFIMALPSKITLPEISNLDPSAAKVKNGEYGFIVSEDEIPFLFIDQDTVIFKEGSRSVKSRNGGTALGQDVLDVPLSDALHVAVNTWDESYNSQYVGEKTHRIFDLSRCCVKGNYMIPIMIINGVLAYNIFNKIKSKRQETVNLQSWGKNFRDVKFDIICGTGSNFRIDCFRACYKIIHVDVDSNYNATIGSQPSIQIEDIQDYSKDITPDKSVDPVSKESLDNQIKSIDIDIDYSGNDYDYDMEL